MAFRQTLAKTAGRVAALASLCVLSACQTFSTPAGPVFVLVKSVPEGADVTFPDGTTCQTPCRLGITEPVVMTIGRIGYKAQSRLIDQSTPTPLIIRLEPVGRSAPVEEVTLPDL